jgi:hypothetical protein
VIAVKHTRGKAPRDPGKLYGDALAQHKQMEAELSRAFNRWQKSRRALHRLEKRLDRAVLGQVEDTLHSCPFNDTL